MLPKLPLGQCLELLPKRVILDVFEVKIEESEKPGSCQESNPGCLACAASALPLSYQFIRQPDNHQLSQSSIYTAQVVLKCLSLTPGSHSVCAVRTPLWVDRKILSIKREPILSDFSQSKCLELFPHIGIKRN